MKKLTSILILLFVVASGVMAQDPEPYGDYGNEWIDFSKTYWKFKVHKEALHRINTETFEAAGIPTNAADFQLFYQGEEVPIYTTTDGIMGADDFVEFHGVPNDGKFDTQLFWEEEWQLSTQRSAFTDTAVYFLTLNPDVNNLRYLQIENDIEAPDLPEKEDYFTYTSTNITDNTFFTGRPIRTLGGVNSNYSDFEEGEGFVSQVINGINGNAATGSYNVNTPSVFDNGGDAEVEVKVVGRSNDVLAIPDHHVNVSINNEVYAVDTFENYRTRLYNFDIDVDELSDPQTSISITAMTDISNIDKLSTAYLQITYPRAYDFANKRSLRFEINASNASKYMELSNFNGGNAPVLLDLTNNVRINPVLDGTVYKVHLDGVSGNFEPRQMFVCNTTSSISLEQIEEFEEVNFIDYSLTENQGDYLMVTHELLRQGTNDYVAEYADYRGTPDGGNHQVVLADIDQLYDQFAWGIQKHPLSIKNFVNYAIDNWSIDPELLFLVGKSVSYDVFRNNFNAYAACLVPTYGYHPSDIMLSTRERESYLMQLGVGRLPAQTPAEVAAYLDKVKEYEQYKYSDCTKEARLWMKEAMHIAGGTNQDQEEDFVNYLEGYQEIYEDSIFAGTVSHKYSKATTDAVIFPDFNEVISDGLGMINFFGHASGAYWEVNIESPENYDNFGKYPMIVSNSCFVGDIHNYSSQEVSAMAIDFVLEPNRGSIGYLATVAFGYPTYLDIYCTALYNEFSLDSYGKPIGTCIKNSVEDIYSTESDGIKITVQDFTLSGDPGVVITSWERPEYIIEEVDVFTTPAILSAQLDSFAVNVVVTNLGKTVVDSFNVNIERQFPGTNMTQVTTKRFPSTVFNDTLSVYVETDALNGLGTNNLTVSVDFDNEIDEDCEDNNRVVKNIYIFSDLLIPVNPCNFSIVNDPNVTLFASTGTPISDNKNYIFQIDTTELFNSPILKQFETNDSGGIITWQPNMNLQENTVYYWRTTLVPESNENYPWQYSSFVYKPDSGDGWNQSHYYQFIKDEFNTMSLDSATREFVYPTFENKVTVKNFYPNTETSPLGYNDLRYYLNDELMAKGACTIGCGGGLMVASFAPKFELEPMISEAGIWEDENDFCQQYGQYGHIHCNTIQDKEAFEFLTDTGEDLQVFLDFYNNQVPDGNYVLIYSITNHKINFDPAKEEQLNQIYEIIGNLGAPEIADVESDQAFVIFGKKGDPNFASTIAFTENLADVIELDILVEGQSDGGSISSSLIGPSSDWHSMHWEADMDGSDVLDLDVFRVKDDGTQEFYFNTADNMDFTLTLDADDYPFMRLIANTQDTASVTAPQLQNWRVLFDPYPEVALDFNNTFTFVDDTLREGQMAQLNMAVTNSSTISSDSLKVRFSVIDSNNETTSLGIINFQPIPAQSTVDLFYEFSTGGMKADNTLLIELSPDNIQKDKYSFNNIALIPFHIVSDDWNPYLDVTFDGVHILNGDIVSAEPEILVRLRDDSEFFALNDTSSFDMTFIYPNGNERQVYFNSGIVNFTPADADDLENGNEAEILLTPKFEQDGVYQLIVQGTDQTGNDSGNNAYKVAFEVINEAMVSHVLNYPNPFTSSTKFVFTLTGSNVPDDFKIQIMSVSGKVVKEVTKAELGDMHIGRNVSDYAWDGTDTYGNELANGVYFYRVIAQNEEEDIKKYQTDATSKMDDLFNQYGIGKMYLMR